MELGVSNEEHGVVVVDVVNIEREGFAEAHPGNSKQAKQSRIGAGHQRMVNTLSRYEQSCNVLVRVDIRLVSNRVIRDQAYGWNFVPRVRCVQVPRETTQDVEVFSVRDGPGVIRLGSPIQSQRYRHDRGLLLPHVLDELAELVFVSLEFEAESTTHSQVGIESEPEIVHAPPPGHGWASLRKVE